jgi:glycosyltransferase involved in cell wall biosynthesis
LNRSHEVSALFFGNVRPYKGLYVLLEALRSAPCVRLTVAGNFWGQEIEIAQWLADSGLTNRVSLKNGYVPSEDIPSLFRQADIVVLPYLTGTASVIPQMAFSHGVPVIVTNVGSIAAGVETGVNGFIVAPNSSRDLAKALATFADSAEARKTLEVGAQKSNTDDHWDKYREAVINLIELVAR